MTSPTQRALALYKKRGCKVFVAERWNGFAKIRQDAFGFGDLLVIDPVNQEIILVQVTSATNHSTRVNKVLSISEAKDWLQAKGKIVVMSFKRKDNGRYDVREEFINMENICQEKK